MRAKYQKKIKCICKNCGQESIKNNKQIFCSKKCYRDYKIKEFEINNHKEICPICGKEDFLRRTCHGIKVCNNKCATTLYSRTWRKDNPNYQSEHIQYWKENPKPRKTEVECKWCNIKFSQKRYNQVFCSLKCNDNWQSKYGKKHETFLKKRENKLKAIGFCRLCGIQYKDILNPKELGMKHNCGKFHSDHIIPFSHGGSDNEENKRWLCWFCNLTRNNLPNQFDAAIAECGKAFWQKIKELINPNKCINV